MLIYKIIKKILIYFFYWTQSNLFWNIEGIKNIKSMFDIVVVVIF